MLLINKGFHCKGICFKYSNLKQFENSLRFIAGVTPCTSNGMFAKTGLGRRHASRLSSAHYADGRMFVKNMVLWNGICQAQAREKVVLEVDSQNSRKSLRSLDIHCCRTCFKAKVLTGNKVNVHRYLYYSFLGLLFVLHLVTLKFRLIIILSSTTTYLFLFLSHTWNTAETITFFSSFLRASRIIFHDILKVATALSSGL
jgi:hypothetical protein